MPGVVHKDFHQRGGRDYRLDAKLTLRAFEQIKTKGNPPFIKCQLVGVDERYANFRLEEVQEQQFVTELNKSLNATTQRQLEIDIDIQIKNIIEREKKSTNGMSNARESKASKLKNIRENRKIEKEFLRAKEHWGDTLEYEKKEIKGEVIGLKDYKNEDKDEGEEDYLLDLIMQYDEKED